MVLLKGGNALFKCSPREHTEDKTAPRRRIRRVNRHLLFLPVFFSLPRFISTAVLQEARQFSRCISLQLLDEQREVVQSVFFFLLYPLLRKEMIFHR